MKVIFMGSPDFSVPVLDALVEAGHEIACVYCQPPRPAGRGKKERPTPVHARAEELGLPVRHPVNFKDPADVAAFEALQAEIAVVVAYGLLLPQSILDAPEHGCLNIHASLLPRWRGAAPIHRAILEGDDKTGVCIMQMEAGLDTGPVLLRQETDITAEDTTAVLHDRLSEMGADAITVALDSLEQLVPEPQPDAGVTYAKKIDKAEAKIDWTRPAAEIDRQIRGLSPFPGAWAMLNGERIKFHMSRVTEGDAAPGEVIGAFTIACGEGAVEILTAQREGKRAMPVTEILKGLDLPRGSRFE
ncbi:methionyl-tRNA formyltransferase [Celeribacter halophilus]|uniref:Methionyl-tRNA formyltransferase n=1 Tax=Celeribacter halophilus TaxID=576117 RepID=A0A1I3ST92_9RHOB|nr:methionyl-tRNA formyltransferase [Celeribacter halophilus]PZX12117.1 methionyl-tRNA formyltransferase [Celeribacter halophilus]SFJ61462.1 methionyl-tRNA formyltransferase [Celeribacter halophilus]